MEVIKAYDRLHLYAFDQLSCPAAATECERVFSAAKQTREEYPRTEDDRVPKVVEEDRGCRRKAARGCYDTSFQG